MAQEKERTANEHLMELSARVASLEVANSRIKQEKAQLAVQVENDRSRLEELQDVRNRYKQHEAEILSSIWHFIHRSSLSPQK